MVDPIRAFSLAQVDFDSGYTVLKFVGALAALRACVLFFGVISSDPRVQSIHFRLALHICNSKLLADFLTQPGLSCSHGMGHTVTQHDMHRGFFAGRGKVCCTLYS